MSTSDIGPLVLGGNTFGWTSDRETSFAVLDAFVEAGGRSIDTADVYSAWAPGHTGGESETIIGEWIASRRNRDHVHLATKVYSHPERPGLSPANVRAAVDDSLRRLQTDYIDLYYAHRDDLDVPQEEYVGVFGELVAEGKVRNVGASNFTADRLRTAVALAHEAGVAPFTYAQDEYNLIARDLEDELLPTLAELNIVELPYRALAGGFLTGKYRDGTTIDSPRAAGASALGDDARNRALLDQVHLVARRHDTTATAVSIAWLRQQPGVGAPIASARDVNQLSDVAASFTLSLTAEDLADLQ